MDLYARPYSSNQRDIEDLESVLRTVIEDNRSEVFDGSKVVKEANWQLLDTSQVKDLEVTSPVVDWNDADSATRPERIKYREKLEQRFPKNVVEFLMYYDLWLQASNCLITVEGAVK